MILLRVLIVSLILHYCAPEEYNIIPSADTQCYSWSCYTLENLTIEDSFDATIQLIFQPGNYQLSSQLEIVDKDYFSLSSSNDTEKTKITCNNDGRLLLANIHHAEISNVVFLGCGQNTVNNIATLIVQNCAYINHFKGNGSLLQLNSTNATIKICSFQETIGTGETAMLISCDSNVTIEKTDFTSKKGGLISCTAREKTIIAITNSIFSKSSVQATTYDTPSALIHILNSNFTMEGSTIENNEGEMIVFARNSNVNISKSKINSNSADNCIFCFVKNQVYLNDLVLTDNIGNFSVVHLLKTGAWIIDGLHFSRNNGSFLIMTSHVEFTGCKMLNNSMERYNESQLQAEGTLTVIQSTVVFNGNAEFLENYSQKSGGALYASQSKITILGNISVMNNFANSGGGAFFYLTTFVCRGNCTFSGNRAYKRGGGIHAIGTLISVSYSGKKDYQTSLILTGNQANKGGGLYLEANSKLTGSESGYSRYEIGFIQNIADSDGGAIFIEDETYLDTCRSKSYWEYKTETECFLQALYNDVKNKPIEQKHSINFMNNTAMRGSVLYGGLLDRCTVSPMADIYNNSIYTTTTSHTVDGFTYFLKEGGLSLQNVTDEIASDAVRICFCYNTTYNCSSKQPNITVQKSKEFILTVVAVDQVNRTLDAYIRSILAEGSSLGEGQQLQHVSKQCTNLMFNISSLNSSVQLNLYADQSPCRTLGLSFLSVKINFTECNCSIGFRQTNQKHKCECECDPTLEPYVVVYDSNSFVRKTNTWISYTSDIHGNDYMYIIHPNCPYDYCLPPSPTTGIINLNEPNGADAQCNFNRSGLLCGQCREGYSMSAGGLNCIKCPEQWQGLAVLNVLIVLVSGIVLVMLFLFLNLTVALGTVNGIIFYANVVLVNRSVFLPYPKQKLILFIYILNTRLGLHRCIYEGMDAYGNVWLSILFPLYLICLVLIIIIVTKYSSRCAQLIGNRNPVATLATLILLSYAYFLRIILKIFSFTTLKYPNNVYEIVWLSDASIKYFQGKHIPLFLTGLVLLIIGLAYTIILFSWQWLLHASNIVLLKWVKSTKLNCFIDAYHAPYQSKYRYWTGLLLFARVLLNIIITLNISGDPQYNLLTTGILTALLIMLKTYVGNRVYKNKILDYVENACYFNLLFLTVVTFYVTQRINAQKISTDISISVTLVLTFCVILYHIHYAFSKFMWYRKVLDCILYRIKRNRSDTLNNSASTVNNKHFKCSSTEVWLSNSTEGSATDDKFQYTYKTTKFTAQDQQTTCTSSSCTLREPLLQDF